MKNVFISLAVFIFSISVISIQSCTNAGPPKASVSDAIGTEGGQATVNINLSKESDVTVRVSYSTTGGTATSNTDFGSLNGYVDFTPGQTNKPIVLNLHQDGITEGNESFTITIVSLDIDVKDATGTITIQDGSLSSGYYLFGTVDGQYWTTLGGSHGGTSDQDVGGLNWIYTGGIWIDFSTYDEYGEVNVFGPYTGVGSDDFYNVISEGSKGFRASGSSYGGYISFVDASGTEWRTNNGSQSGSSFVITKRYPKSSSGMFADFEGEFSCKLYGPGGAVKTLTNGHFRSNALLRL